MENFANSFKAIINIIICLASAYAAFAQVSINGKIEAVNGEPVPFANVLLLHPGDSSLIIGGVSNQEGNFLLSGVEKGSYLVNAAMIGFSHAYIRLEVDNESIQLDPITLHEGTRELDAVIITSKKPLYEKMADRTVVNVQSSITSTGKTALEVIERSPGVAVNQQSNSLSMLGKTGVLVMINGKMTGLPIDAVIQMLDGMSAANIDKIELITTPPAKYDAEGNAGIINIEMIENPDMGTSGNFGLTGGYNQGATLGTNFNLTHRGQRYNYFLDYSIRSDRNQQTWIERRTLLEEGFNRTIVSTSQRDPHTTVQNLRAGIEYQVSAETSIKGLITGYRRNWDMDARTEVVNEAGPDSVINTNMDLHESNIWQSIGGSIGMSHQINQRQLISFDFDYLYYFNDNPSKYYNSSIQIGNLESSDEIIRVNKETPINFKVAKFDYSNQVNEKISVEAGVKSTFSRFNNRVQIQSFIQDKWVIEDQFTNNSTLDEKILAMYFTLDWAPAPGLKVNGGLRYEYTDSNISTPEDKDLVDREFGNFFPSISVAQNFNKESKIQISYAKRITRPTFNDMAPFVFFTGPNSLYAGNPALLPAIANAVDISYQLKQWWVSVGYSATSNSIGWLQPEIDPVTNEQVFRSHNLRYLRSWSFSNSLAFNITNWWEIQADMSVYYQTFKTSQFQSNFTEEVLTTTINATNNITLSRNYSLEISGNYQSNVLYGIWKTPSMGQLDFGIRKKLNNGKGTLTLSATDILDTSIWKWEANVPGINALLNGSIDQNLRSINLTYTRSFGNRKLKSVNIRSGSGDERNRVN